MKSFKHRQGAQLNFEITQGDSTSVSATFLMKHQEDDTIIEYTENYVSGVANISIPGADLTTLGVYDYQINENFSDSESDIYPDASDCDGDCDLPTIEICESIQPEGS